MLYLCSRLCWLSPKILRVFLLCGTYDIEQYGRFYPTHTGTRPIDYMAQEGVLVGFYFQIHTALSHLGRGNLTWKVVQIGLACGHVMCEGPAHLGQHHP